MGRHGRRGQTGGSSGSQRPTRYPEHSEDDILYQARTNHVKNKQENIISERQIFGQLAGAPAPQDKGKSGYPHHFLNEDDQFPELIIPNPANLEKSPSNASSTTSHYEYPVFADGHTYDYDTKKKHMPPDAQGHLRAITSQKKKLKAVIAHDGEDNKAWQGPMHWAEKKEPPKKEGSTSNKQ